MPTPDSVAMRLRHIRQQQNLTLKQVEIKSRGKWKAVVVGSYERGTRSLSIQRASELCTFYEVPLSALFKDSVHNETQTLASKLVIDLRKLRKLDRNADIFTQHTHQLLQWIAEHRDDWNGEVLSMRKSDTEILAMLTNKSPMELIDALTHRDLLLKN